jgi:hypothetical protein
VKLEKRLSPAELQGITDKEKPAKVGEKRKMASENPSKENVQRKKF